VNSDIGYFFCHILFFTYTVMKAISDADSVCSQVWVDQCFVFATGFILLGEILDFLVVCILLAKEKVIIMKKTRV